MGLLALSGVLGFAGKQVSSAAKQALGGKRGEPAPWERGGGVVSQPVAQSAQVTQPVAQGGPNLGIQYGGGFGFSFGNQAGPLGIPPLVWLVAIAAVVLVLVFRNK